MGRVGNKVEQRVNYQEGKYKWVTRDEELRF